ASDSTNNNSSTGNQSLNSISSKIDDLKESLTNIDKNFSENKSDEFKLKIDSLQSQFNQLQSKINRSDFDTLLDEKLSQGHLTPVIKDKVLAVSNFMEAQNFSSDFSQDKFNKEVRG